MHLFGCAKANYVHKFHQRVVVQKWSTTVDEYRILRSTTVDERIVSEPPARCSWLLGAAALGFLPLLLRLLL